MKTIQKLAAALSCLVALRSYAISLVPIPAEIASTHFVVSIDGKKTPVMHAALNLYFLNFEARQNLLISITADSDDFWAKGVEIQPWRLNVHPKRVGRTITFRLNGPAKISISRPGDFGFDAEMLYLFANPKEQRAFTANTPGIRYFGPGAHFENIDAAAGDHIVLADGAVLFGSLNIWQVDGVSVSGRGVIVYDGPQNPADDDGWKHRRNWHCIVMDHAHDVSIEGITCVVRSRTWQIQMKDSRRILFENVKVIGANAGNANADGMDWLGGGDTIVRNSFFRAADDVFALQTSWEGYGPAAFAVQGQPVTNITVEKSVLSTSISNIVRAGWPEKNFEGGNFVMRDSDVIHMGFGGCGIPFALMELWADPNGRGVSAGFHFENIRMEDWYSLTQLQQPVDRVSDITFTDVIGLESPPLVESTLKGSIHDVMFSNLITADQVIENSAELQLTVETAAPPAFLVTLPRIQTNVTPGLLRPGQRVHFEVLPNSDKSPTQYDWTFGDGQHGTGRKVSHKFANTEGTLLDGTGRYRVLLEAKNPEGRHTILYMPTIISNSLQSAITTKSDLPGIKFQYREANVESGIAHTSDGVASGASLDAVRHRAENYSLTFEGDLLAPADGGYTFQVVANDSARVEIDNVQTDSLPALPQVCGLAGMAARNLLTSAALAKGKHHVRITESHTVGKDNFRVLWQGPGFALGPIDPALWTH